MWGVESDAVRGEPVRRGALEVVPVVKTWSLRVGPAGGGWTWLTSYSAPAVEVTHADDEPEQLMLPDVGLWVRLAVVLLVALVMLGGRR